ncbi:hypothetical protein [Nocardioides sp. AN3]
MATDSVLVARLRDAWGHVGTRASDRLAAAAGSQAHASRGRS